MFIVLSIIVLVAVFNILSSLIMLVRAKTRDIAILRTMGATRRSLLKIFVTTGFVIGALGTVAGLLLGFVFLYFRQPIVRGIEMHHRAEPVGSLDPLPHRTAQPDRSGGSDGHLRHGAGVQLPCDALSGAQGGEHRSGAGAAL